jgi:hypothetical protein
MDRRTKGKGRKYGGRFTPFPQSPAFAELTLELSIQPFEMAL